MNYMKMTDIGDQYNYLIIGASQAGLTAAQELRNLDPHGSIALISQEKCLPYKRTKLSKILCEELPQSLPPIYPSDWYKSRAIDLFISAKASLLDMENRQIEITGNKQISYEKVLIATGGAPSKLKIPGEGHIHYLRDWQDAQKIRKAMGKAKKMAVIGSGVEGIELADQMVKAHKKVVLISIDKGPMVKWLDTAQQENLKEEMSHNRVHQYYEEELQRIEKKRNSYVLLTDNHHFHADLILASTGIKTNTQLLDPYEEVLIKQGLILHKGIPINTHMETPFPNIFAAGDVINLPGDFSQGLWHSAEYQGLVAARNMAGRHQNLQKKSFRLKAEVFGQYYFSQNYKPDTSLLKDAVLINDHRAYLRVFTRKGKVISALMTNRKDIAKEIQKLVQAEAKLEALTKIL